MLYIKKYSGFIISIVIGLLLYEEANYAYTYRAATAYSDHMIYRLILSMGSGSSGWNPLSDTGSTSYGNIICQRI
jgi:hypothetical protein